MIHLTTFVSTTVRAFGLVGYDTAFTRRRSPVRIRQGPFSLLDALK